MTTRDASDGPEPSATLFKSGRAGERQKNYRRILSQVCATIAQSLLILDVGMMVVAPTVIIGELHNSKQGQLSLNDSQSSWFAGCMLLCQPLGCLLSGYAQGFVGRKDIMLLTNVPHLAAWYLLYAARSPAALYAASAIMGVGIGFMEAPTLNYIGEISEPHVRGTLATIANANVVAGYLLEFALGWSLPWRAAMLAGCSVPVIAAVAVSLIPESPIWLLQKGRNDEAMASLRWLRGWASFEEVSEEYRRLVQYCQASTDELKTRREITKIKNSSAYTVVKDCEYGTTAHDEPGFADRFRDFLRPGILRPLRLVIVYMFFAHAACLSAVRPYMIEIFVQLNVPVSPGSLTVVTAALQGLGALTCICLVRPVGKRTLSLVSMAGCSLCCLLLGGYAHAMRWHVSVPTVPLTLFCAFYYCTNVGISPVPWLLISEVFPNRGRGVAGSVCAGVFYAIAFVMGSTWLNLQDLVELRGGFFLYGTLGIFGVVYVYFCLPETEGKTLAEIEQFFIK